jgi:hypothetical protein
MKFTKSYGENSGECRIVNHVRGANKGIGYLVASDVDIGKRTDEHEEKGGNRFARVADKQLCGVIHQVLP